MELSIQVCGRRNTPEQAEIAPDEAGRARAAYRARTFVVTALAGRGDDAADDLIGLVGERAGNVQDGGQQI